MEFKGIRVMDFHEGKRPSQEEVQAIKARGHYLYAMRHGDDGDMSVPVTIEPGVFVNYFGYIVTEIPLIFESEDDPYIPLTEDERYDLLEIRDHYDGWGA
jgi:hypothetical protein